jgi:hypothetical protein
MRTTDACGDMDDWWQKYATMALHKQRIVFNENGKPGTC